MSMSVVGCIAFVYTQTSKEQGNNVFVCIS